jgi:hypothetical protein
MNSTATKSDTTEPRPASPSRRGAHLFRAVVLILLALGVYEAAAQYLETRYVRSAARVAAGGTEGKDELSVVVALRDYVRRNVSHKEYPGRGRPFLRDTAAETLRSGRGHCGEATRAFINMAGALGIRAQRLYLEGRRPHVVAEVELRDGGRLIVDSYDEAYIPDLETLDDVMRRPQFSHYSSLNFRRTPLALAPRRLDLGPLSYFMENPHALKSLVWLALAVGLVLTKSLSAPALSYLRRRRGARAAAAGG